MCYQTQESGKRISWCILLDQEQLCWKASISDNKLTEENNCSGQLITRKLISEENLVIGKNHSNHSRNPFCDQPCTLIIWVIVGSMQKSINIRLSSLFSSTFCKTSGYLGSKTPGCFLVWRWNQGRGITYPMAMERSLLVMVWRVCGVVGRLETLLVAFEW